MRYKILLIPVTVLFLVIHAALAAKTPPDSNNVRRIIELSKNTQVSSNKIKEWWNVAPPTNKAIHRNIFMQPQPFNPVQLPVTLAFFLTIVAVLVIAIKTNAQTTKL